MAILKYFCVTRKNSVVLKITCTIFIVVLPLPATQKKNINKTIFNHISDAFQRQSVNEFHQHEAPHGSFIHSSPHGGNPWTVNGPNSCGNYHRIISIKI
jgi:hypothetical protein